ncbi:MAG: hypothetical protein H0U65_12950 [Rubrobacter sp.]|jgi:hypothetical protein|nr:hypothetical protein [Rubrobacter sp.]
MRIDVHESKDLLVSHGKEVERILRFAARRALLDHKRAGNPVASWEDGRVVMIEAGDIPLEDSGEKRESR